MTKIDFKNLPDTSTPLSAENLNTMQDNIEDAIDNVSIDLDDEVSTTSTNGVENQAITNYVDDQVQDAKDYTDSLLEIQDITSQITWKTGFERKDGRLWKQGKRIFGTLNIGCNMTTGTQALDIFTIPYTFTADFVFSGFATTRDQWGYPDGACYCFMSRWGHFNATPNINAKFLRVQFEFITA